MFDTHCARCKISFQSVPARMSRFNTDMCCPDCLTLEEQHPDYTKAKESELAAVKRGDYNFPGIGKPTDL